MHCLKHSIDGQAICVLILRSSAPEMKSGFLMHPIRQACGHRGSSCMTACCGCKNIGLPDWPPFALRFPLRCCPPPPGSLTSLFASRSFSKVKPPGEALDSKCVLASGKTILCLPPTGYARSCKTLINHTLCTYAAMGSGPLMMGWCIGNLSAPNSLKAAAAWTARRRCRLALLV